MAYAMVLAHDICWGRCICCSAIRPALCGPLPGLRRPFLTIAATLCTSSAGRLHVSLSLLNHWLPRGQTDSEVMQGTAEFHHEIADTVLPQPDPVFDDTTALDAAVDMLDP